MDNLYSNKYSELLFDNTFRSTAERLVIKCGIRVDLKGFSCLVDAIILYGTAVSSSFCEIYRIIGEVRNIKYKTVMREISYAVMQAFDISQKLSELIGLSVPVSDIHSGLVIAYLGKLFQNPDLSLYSDKDYKEYLSNKIRM